MTPRVVAAANGWQWMVEGFILFRKAPMTWIAMTLLLTILWLATLFVPILGPFLFNLFSPVFFAGILIGCHTTENDDALQVSHLFAGFRHNVPALVSVGGVYLAGTIIIISAVIMSVGASSFTLIKPGQAPDIETAMALMRSMGGGLLIAFVLYIPLMMAIWFAPALILFDNLGALDAMKQSFMACLANTLPFLIYGLALSLLWIVATIPLFLGLLILLPVVFCSVYTSYRDIFAPRAATPPSADHSLLK